jgi:predicted O-methyltransferase YrrM
MNDFLENSVLKLLLNGNPIVGETGKSFDKGGCSSVNNLITLHNIILKHEIKNSLEVGFLFGTSALAILLAYQKKGFLKDSRHVAIDPFQKTSWDNAGKVIVKSAGFENNIKIIDDYSCFALPALIKQNQKFDLIYIDGSHLFEDVFTDFYFSDKLLPVGGIVLFDDNSDPHVHKVTRFIKTNYNSYYERLDLDQYVNRTGFKKLKFKAASLIGKTQLLGFTKISDSQRSWDSRFHKF